MKLMIEIDEARFKDIQRIAEVQLESNHFQTAEQIIASGSDVLDKIRAEIPTLSRYQSSDGQDLVMVADVFECINKHINGEGEEDEI